MTQAEEEEGERASKAASEAGGRSGRALASITARLLPAMWTLSGTCLSSALWPGRRAAHAHRKAATP